MTSERTVDLIRLAYYRPSWATVVRCHLQGLFVTDDARGCDIGRTLGEHVDAGARRRVKGRVYWLTHESGHNFMSLCDHIAGRSRFINYRKLVA